MTTFRITQQMMVDRSLTAMQTSLARVSKVQEQLSSGRVLNRPSDSPTDTAQAMRLRSSLADTAQFVRNADDGGSRLALADQTLTSVTDQVRRARELGLQGANSGASSTSSREALATEIDQLRTGILDDANATYVDRPIFGGVTAGTKAYDDTGAYIGQPGAVTRRIADGVQVRVDVDGPSVFGAGGGASGSVFDELDALSTALRVGDDAAVKDGLTRLSARLDRVGVVQAQAGSTAARIERGSSALEDSRLSLTTSLSSVENVDLPAATVQLGLQQVAYQAALSATAKVLQPSLLDFLR